MKNIPKYKALSYIYHMGTLRSINRVNDGEIRGISEVPKELFNTVAELKEYVEYVNSFGNGLGYYLTPEGMNYVESHKGFLKQIELRAGDYPYVGSFVLGFLGGGIAIVLEKIFG